MNRYIKIVVLLGLAAVLLVSAVACSKETASGPVASIASEPEASVALTSREIASEAPQRSISVTGSGAARAAPDIAYIQLGVDTQSLSPSEAAEENARRMNSAIAAIRELGVEEKDIRTTDYRIFVEKKYQDGKPTGEIEYHMTNQVQVTLRNLDLVGILLERVVSAEVNNIGGISFGLSDPAALQRKAREIAMADAKARAQQLAEGLGVKLGAPLQISEWAGGGPVRADVAAMELARSAAVPPVSGGELEINVQVSVSFAIE